MGRIVEVDEPVFKGTKAQVSIKRLDTFLELADEWDYPVFVWGYSPETRAGIYYFVTPNIVFRCEEKEVI